MPKFIPIGEGLRMVIYNEGESRLCVVCGVDPSGGEAGEPEDTSYCIKCEKPFCTDHCCDIKQPEVDENGSLILTNPENEYICRVCCLKMLAETTLGAVK